MAISLASLNRGIDRKPPRIIIMGVQGIGKSTFGADAEKPVFVLTEDGKGKIETESFPLAKTLDDVMESLGVLAQEEHAFKTVVVDSLDWLEPLIWAKVAADQKVKNLEDIGYGKGYVFAMDYWREYLDALNWLRDNKGMTIIQTAHSEIKKYQNPETDPYDRYEIKLHKSAAGKVLEHADIVLFANYRTGITKQEMGFKKVRTRAVGSGERVLYTEERPTHLAKNRYGLPFEIPFTRDGTTWATIAENVPFYSAPPA